MTYRSEKYEGFVDVLLDKIEGVAAVQRCPHEVENVELHCQSLAKELEAVLWCINKDYNEEMPPFNVLELQCISRNVLHRIEMMQNGISDRCLQAVHKELQFLWFDD